MIINNIEDNSKITEEGWFFYCDSCSNKIGISIYSSAGICEILRQGWRYKVIEIPHIIPEQIIKSKYIGNKIIKEHSKVEKKIIIECDLCQRVNKIKKIKEKMGI